MCRYSASQQSNFSCLPLWPQSMPNRMLGHMDSLRSDNSWHDHCKSERIRIFWHTELVSRHLVHVWFMRSCRNVQTYITCWPSRLPTVRRVDQALLKTVSYFIGGSDSGNRGTCAVCVAEVGWFGGSESGNLERTTSAGTDFVPPVLDSVIEVAPCMGGRWFVRPPNCELSRKFAEYFLSEVCVGRTNCMAETDNENEFQKSHDYGEQKFWRYFQFSLIELYGEEGNG